MVEQGDAGYGQWEVTHMGLSFTGKLLLFKGLNIQSDEKFTDFRPVAKNLNFAEGVELARKEAQGQLVCRQCPAKGMSTD